MQHHMTRYNIYRDPSVVKSITQDYGMDHVILKSPVEDAITGLTLPANTIGFLHTLGGKEPNMIVLKYRLSGWGVCFSQVSSFTMHFNTARYGRQLLVILQMVTQDNVY